MAEHAFVAMPFGCKEGVDFNKVYSDLIKPALESAGFEVFRADEELRAGNIRTDMFQELLLADLVVAELSIDNPNVWYELGVRHALRKRGVIQIQAKRDYLPFDVYVDRALRYQLKDGVPDPAHLEADRRALAVFAQETMRAWRERRVSPVYHLLPYLQQPEWKRLRLGDVNELWQQLEAWEQRIEVARQAWHPGDILVFAGEVPSRHLRLEAHRAAGNALLKLGQFEFARRQFELALEIDPADLESRQKKGIALGRLDKFAEARVWLDNVVKDHPEDAESWALLGRVEKDAWTSAWRRPAVAREQLRRAAAAEAGRLREAIRAYRTGFRKDPRNYYSGINALTLICLWQHLTGKKEPAQERKALEGGVRWAVQCALDKRADDYWARVTLGDLELLAGKPAAAESAYGNAVAVAGGDWFALNSPLQQLRLLQELGFEPEMVEAAAPIFVRALAHLEAPWKALRVFLFSGHLIDKPDRAAPRFPADKEMIAAAAIGAKLDELGAGPEDLALCGGANGGDILFAEACQARGLRLEIHIPFDEPAFLRSSVSFAGEQWVRRYFKMKEHPETRLFVMSDQLGTLPAGLDPYARNNLWQLYTALAWGPEKVRFVCLWDRKAGDGPGGTQHMVETVEKHSGQTYVLDTTRLWPPAAGS
ncbi:MAG TPA: TRAFs-binding domain-containing protein [Thermoanaerobaculia bacterium]|nr:TRAFs-binding domain-containing protein [Thermoanaerobaculia bacterium]